ncbi:hypothetical protein [Sphingomonas sp.]|uniref:hypothetical protein n=1 Tax=Sphingomonas sp. TaxID=28214 RepID=UPI003D6CD68E
MTGFLLDNRFSPVTNSIGFLKCDPDRAARAYMDWQAGIQAKRGVRLAQEPVSGPLLNALRSLLPLTSVETRRFLFLPTRSPWTAFLDNGHDGTDVFAPISFLAQQLGCEGIRATATPHAPEDRLFGATILEIYGPHKTEFLNYIRSVASTCDGYGWSFSAAGTVQPFEDPARYAQRKIQSRFTLEMLNAYLNAMGIDAFDMDFYLPDNRAAIRIEKIGPSAPAMREVPTGF